MKKLILLLYMRYGGIDTEAGIAFIEKHSGRSKSLLFRKNVVAPVPNNNSIIHLVQINHFKYVSYQE